MKTIIETERLILRELTLKDAPFIFDLLNTKGWLQFVGDRNIKHITDAENYLTDKLLLGYHLNGFGFWCVQLKQLHQSIGICGLIKRDGLKNVDIGFAFLPEFEGKGYAYESAIATKNYAFGNLKINRLDAIVQEDNQQSIKLLKKIGMSFVEMVTLPNEHEALMLYSKRNDEEI